LLFFLDAAFEEDGGFLDVSVFTAVAPYPTGSVLPSGLDSGFDSVLSGATGD
jgi:hypothetical protein